MASQAQFCPTCGAPRPAGVFAPPPSMERPGIITLLAVLQFLAAAALLAGGVALLAIDASPDQRSTNAIIAAILFLFALLSLAAGAGLMAMKPWGRALQIVLACIGLLVFPVGTILSILILVYLFRPGVKLLFSGRKIEELAPHELAALQGARVNGGVVVGIALVFVLLVPFAGIIAAIAIPNFLTATQRAKQKRTMADMRSIAVKVEQYRVEHGRLPQASSLEELRKEVDRFTVTGVDGWGKEIRYGADGTSYWLISAGKDMAFEHDDVALYESGQISRFDEDIVFRDGEFVRLP